MAHSWVMSFADELEAFRQYAAVFGRRAIFLIDTYDTLEAARRLVRTTLRPAAVRLDSGDIVALSRSVRDILDRAGLREVDIFVSGDLDEYRIARYLEQGAAVNGFGVGTALSTSSDAPSLGGIYKLVEVERAGRWVPTMKLSEAKRSYPGRKQVWRLVEGGVARGDVIGLSDEPPPPGGAPLLHRIMRAGRREAGAVQPLAELRSLCRDAIARLPATLHQLEGQAPYPVAISEPLARLSERVRSELSPAAP